jgi:molybdate transport system substrate-binding protein
MRAFASILLCVVFACGGARGQGDGGGSSAGNDGKGERDGVVRVAAAISLREALGQTAKAYEADTGRRVELTFGSSGQLAAQIKSGAPIDAFVSAANKQVDELEKAGLVDAKTRRVVAGNDLVLIVPASSSVSLADFKSLSEDAVKKLAIGEPKTVPAGQYARQVLAKLEIERKLADRLVYGANVRQVLDYVERGEVTAGIVYATDAKESGEKVKVVATADAATHEPIEYPAVVVKESKKPAAAAAFLDYLKSDRARKIFQDKGFTRGGDHTADDARAPK